MYMFVRYFTVTLALGHYFKAIKSESSLTLQCCRIRHKGLTLDVIGYKWCSPRRHDSQLAASAVVPVRISELAMQPERSKASSQVNEALYLGVGRDRSPRSRAQGPHLIAFAF